MGAALYRDHGESRAPRVKRRWEERWLDPAFQDWDDGAALGGVQCPVLVVHGADDPFWHTEHAEAIVERLLLHEALHGCLFVGHRGVALKDFQFY